MLESIITAECPNCKEPGPVRHGLCENCLLWWKEWLPEHRCAICSVEIRGVGTICQRCLEAADRFDRAFFLVPYHDPARNWLHQVKFKDKLEWLNILDELTEKWEPELRKWEPDVVSWIPSSPLTWWGRAYNLSRQIALRVSERLGVPAVRLLRPGTLYKRPLSTSRNPAHRRRIVRRFLRPHPCPAEMDHVLLVDDVFTTGATLNQAARLIRRHADVRTISVFTLMRVT